METTCCTAIISPKIYLLFKFRPHLVLNHLLVTDLLDLGAGFPNGLVSPHLSVYRCLDIFVLARSQRDIGSDE